MEINLGVLFILLKLAFTFISVVNSQTSPSVDNSQNKTAICTLTGFPDTDVKY